MSGEIIYSRQLEPLFICEGTAVHFSLMIKSDYYGVALGGRLNIRSAKRNRIMRVLLEDLLLRY